eukprot:7367426-Pyramimonas_sp.AAC.1
MKYLGEIFALLCACIAVVVGSPDVGFDGLFRSSTEEVSSWCMQAPIPPHVNGEFIISGPALFEHAGTNFTCVLDAFGKVNRFQLSKGVVCYSAAMLKSGFYNDSMKAGQIAPGCFSPTPNLQESALCTIPCVILWLRHRWITTL